MRIPDPPVDPVRVAEFTDKGYWLDTTSNDALAAWALMAPNRMVVGDAVPAPYFDLRAFLDAADGPTFDRDALRRSRPHANDLCRTAFTSGTTGDPKAVLHLHNTTNCAARFVNETHRIGPDNVLLASQP